MPSDRVLFLGDVSGPGGRRALAAALPGLRERFRPVLVIANGENIAGGFGLTNATLDELYAAGVDCVTTGDHFLDKREIAGRLDAEPRLLRPLNFPPPVPGTGIGFFGPADARIAVLNVMGRAFFTRTVDCPFRRTDEVIAAVRAQTPIIIVDFHAEATAEKQAYGFHVDGRVTAVLGTHTHVATADEGILPGGTAYISDVGMTGAFDSVIGMKKELSLARFINQVPVHLESAEHDLRVCGAVVEFDRATGRAQSIARCAVPIPETR